MNGARFPFLAALVYTALLALAVAGLSGCGGGAEHDEHDQKIYPPSCSASGFCS